MAFKFRRADLFRRTRMLRILVVAACFLAIVVTAMSEECNLPPSQWCSSVDISEKCGVYEQCKLALRIDPFAGPVNMTLYFESLCPDCQNFIADQLYHTWQALGTNVLNLTLVPYGNAYEYQDEGIWKFNCQHGKEECIGNVIETCAIDILGNISVYLPFIHCMESENVLPEKAAKQLADNILTFVYRQKTNVEKVRQCATNLSIDIDDTLACANGPRGSVLEHEMAVKTDSLKPPHNYVPWITLNGVHTERMQRMAETDLLGLVCETYKGPPPKICLQLQECGSRQCVNN